MRVIERLVKEGDTVIDAGAAWGLYAWALAGLVGTRGQVYAFEPNRLFRPSLAGMRRRRRQISVQLLALSDRDGRAELHVPLFTGAADYQLGTLVVAPERTKVAHTTTEVRVARLDSILDGEHVSFIKCDVEGHEFAVLRGAEAILRASRPALLLEIEQRHQETDIFSTFDYLRELGYVGFSLHPAGLRPLAEFDLARDQLAHLGDSPIPGVMPPEYVHDFLFVASEMASKLDPGWFSSPAAQARFGSISGSPVAPRRMSSLLKFPIAHALPSAYTAGKWKSATFSPRRC